MCAALCVVGLCCVFGVGRGAVVKLSLLVARRLLFVLCWLMRVVLCFVL